MRTVYSLIFLLIASNLSAQKDIPFNQNIKYELLKHIVTVDKIPESIPEDWNNDSTVTIGDSIEIYSNPLYFVDLKTDSDIEYYELVDQSGIFGFYCSYVMPSKTHLFLKKDNLVTIISCGYDSDIINQIQILINHFRKYDDLSHSTFKDYLKIIINNDESNRTQLE